MLGTFLRTILRFLLNALRKRANDFSETSLCEASVAFLVSQFAIITNLNYNITSTRRYNNEYLTRVSNYCLQVTTITR